MRLMVREAAMSTSTLTRTMELSEALRYLRHHHLFLIWTDNGVDLWSCGRKMPQPLRRSIYKHREQIAAMMRDASPKVCPARDAGHWKHWVYYPGQGRHVCLMCAAIAV